MKSLRTLILAFLALVPVCRAQVIISEFMADNVSSAFVDEDGAHEDWIELQNLGTASVSLNGWYLTDEAGTDAARTGADLRKWQFPVTSPNVTLTASGTTNSRLVIWCSGKNRKANVGTPTAPRLHTNFKLNNGGEHLALVRPDGVTVEHEIGPQFANFQYPPQPSNYTYGTTIVTSAVTVMPEGVSGKYKVPTQSTDIPAGWNAIAFDDSTWTSAASGIGYGFPSPANDIVVNGNTVPLIATDISAAMAGANKSAFVRFPFQVPNGTSVSAVRLKVRHDDGFVCYLNGVQISSANSPTPLLWDAAATGNKTDTGVTTVVTVTNSTNAPGAIVAGTNVLAFQLMNSDGTGGEPDNACLRPTLEVDVPSGYSFGYFATATMGAANSGTTNGIGPDIADVTQNPSVLPAGGAGSLPIVVTAKVRSTLRPLATTAPVTLKWRRMWGNETFITMLDDGQSATSGDVTAGDGIYSALVPTTSLSAGEMIRWRVEARDNGPTPTYSYAPPYPDFLTNNLNSPPANPPPSGVASKDIAQYYGTIASASPVLQYTQLPVLYWFIKSADATTVINGSNATCSVVYRGRFYDNVYVERHGQSSAGFPTSKKSFNFNFTKDNRMEWSDTNPKVRSFNLLTNYADKTKMRTPTAWKFWSESGQFMSHWTETVRVHQITDTNSTVVANHFWGIYDIVEDGNEDMLQRYGLSPADALYKIYDNMSAVGSAEQKTREDIDSTKSDYQALLNGLDTAQALATRRTYSYDNVDIGAIVNAIAVHGLLVSSDWGHKNYYLYRNTTGTGAWSFVPWDQDLSIGHTWVSAQSYFNDEMDSQRTIRNGATNRLKQVVYDAPEMNKMVVRRMRTLMDQYLGSIATPQNWFETQFASRQNQMDPQGLPVGAKSDAQLDFEKWGFWVHGSGSTISYTDSRAVDHTMRAQASRLVNPFTSVQAAPWNYPGYVTGGNLGSNTTFAWLTGRRRYLYNLDGQNPGSGSDPVPAAQNTPAAGQVVFETVDFKPTSGNGEQEYFVIRNNMSEYLDVSGWRVTGTGGVTVDSADYVFRGGTVIPPFTTGAENIGRLFVARNPAQFRLRSTSPKASEFCYVVGPYNGRLSARGGGLEFRNRNNVVVASTTWSANPTQSQTYLRITELNFRPAPATAGELSVVPGLVANDFEFIELVNAGPTVLNLANAYFDKGVTFTFPAGFTLNPSERCVVVASQTAFETRYGTGFKIAGEFEGTLDNGGETLRILDAAGEEVLEFAYDDDWFPVPTGQYRTFVTRAVNPAYDQYEAPTTWALSSVQNGSPNAQDGEPSRVFEGWRWDNFTQAEVSTVGALNADPDGDGLNNFGEFVFGRLPKTWDRPPELATGGRMNVGGTDYLTIAFRRARNALDVNYIIETNADLSNAGGWTQTGILVSATNLGNGTEDVIYRDSLPVGAMPRFIRVRAVKQQ